MEKMRFSHFFCDFLGGIFLKNAFFLEVGIIFYGGINIIVGLGRQD